MNKLTLKYIFGILLLSLFCFGPSIYATETTEEVIDTVEITEFQQQQIKCLADNIYFEARGEPYLGKVAVARVVMNRVEHQDFHDTPCDVIYQHDFVKRTIDGETKRVKVCQFSWVCSPKRKINQNDAQYNAATQIAQKVLLSDKYNDIIPSTILFFHNTTVKPNWGYRQALKIGNHIFYSRHRR